MGRLAERIDQLNPLQRAVFALKETQAKLDAAERSRTEPIAIVGVSCRFPGGADSPEAFWKLLCEGVDAIREVPPDRWDADALYDPDPQAPGKMNSKWGGFLDRVDGFDNRFFGISDREAARMDPQHRILLELAWEALEDAGLPPARLAGSRTGVYVGIATSDYGLNQACDLTMTDGYSGTGNALSIAANRVSFHFDFRGPSVSLDTACSSSLVAVHLACQSLRSGETKLALAGGVNLILSPVVSVNLTKAGAMAPDGRCRAFDALASGYVRSEGGGLVVLKPLTAALADGDPIYAVIRGSAVNQDGQSNGLTAPNRQAQEAVLREAYAQARIEPGRVQYIETHGTGTLLGDPIEARAIGNVLTADRSTGQPCILGAVKANIGHLETAAGIAGLIKVALALKHRLIPPTPHYKTPNPHIPFELLSLRVQEALAPWPEGPSPAVAGVSSFGFGGTNAHVVIEEAPKPVTVPTAEAPSSSDQAVLLPISARSASALKALAVAYRDLLASGSAPALNDLVFTAGAHRDHHDHRLALVVHSRDEAIGLLDAFARGETRRGLASGVKPYGRRIKSVFLFSGELSGWRSFARKLADREPAFRAAIEDCGRRLGPESSGSLTAWLDTDAPDPLGEDQALASPVLLALQVGLANLLRSWGIVPEAVIGLGRGELAAACVAGALSFEDAWRITQGHFDSIETHATTLTFLSASDGMVRDGRDLDTAYWAAPHAEAVACAAVVEALRDRLPDAFLEIGPPALAEPIARSMPESFGGVLLGAIGPEDAGCEALLGSLAALFALGQTVEWDRLSAQGGRTSRLPSYPWQRERFWVGREVKPVGSHVPRNGFSTNGFAEHAAEPGEAVQPWLYELRWDLKANLQRQPSGSRRRWLILADASGVGDRLAALGAEAGDECLLVHSDGELDEALGTDPTSWDGIVHLWSLDAPATERLTVTALEEAQVLGCGTTLRLLRRVVESRGEGAPKLWLVTRGVHRIGAGASAPAVAQAPLWGLGRALSQEHSKLWGGLVDIDPTAKIDEAAERLQAEIAGSDGEDQVAHRGGLRYVARLARRSEPAILRTTRHLRADGTYLLTGGLGGLGLLIARWLIEHGARRLILLGRTPLPPRSTWNHHEEGSKLAGQIAGVRELEAMGASVHLAAVDVADETALVAFLETFRAEGWPPIRGVIHLAGTTNLKTLMDTDPATLSALFRPKLSGGWLLHRLLSTDPLEFFVLFSSAASILSSPLLGGYAAANAFLDALADYRQALGQPALGVNWGFWSEVGMSARPLRDARNAALARGTKGFTKEQGLEVLGRVLSLDSARVVAVPYLAEDWTNRPPMAIDAPLLRELVHPTNAVDSAASPTHTNGDAPKAYQPRPELNTPFVAPRTELEQLIVEYWRSILKVDRIGVHDNFFELGGDSIQGALFINRLQETLGRVVHFVMLFDMQTVSDLAEYLRQNYPTAVTRMCPTEPIVAVSGGGEKTTKGRLGPEVIAQIRQSLPRLAPRPPGPVRPKNPPALFILAPPRSGTTLLRIMLAGHPRLFAPPELELLSFNTLRDRKAFFSARRAYRLEGTMRAIMEIKGCDAEEARATMSECEDNDLTTQEFYRLLQGWIGTRMLVDKTPPYAYDLNVLERAETDFDGAYYIHLLRHPYGMIHSFEEVRMDLVFYEHKLPYTTRELAELIWVISHQNILSFLKQVPEHRQFRLRFEDLVNQPERMSREMCHFLGLEYNPGMEQPHHDKEKRMTSGIHPDGRMLGDMKFLHSKTVDSTVAEKWAQRYTEDFLGDTARQIALSMGYENFTPLNVQAPTNGASHAVPNALTPISSRSSAQDADRMLANLDQLSDDEVASLLIDAFAEGKISNG